MTATLIDGKAIAQQVRERGPRRGRSEWTAGGHHPPGLATVLVGDDPASAVYVANKQKASAEVGMRRALARPPRRHVARPRSIG